MKTPVILLTAALLSASQAFSADGATVYKTCTPCHQATGAGIPGAFPPLADSEWVNGPVENLIRIQLRGLMGPIEVKGQTYNNMMPANATMSDEDIAAVLTHIRSNFGNNSSAVTPEQVKALRSEVGKPPLKAADLIDPNKKVEPAAKEKAPAAGEQAPEASASEELALSGDVTKSDLKAGPNKLVWGGIAAWSVICILPVLTGFGRKA